jgi:tRNA(Ile)-lysidine synthase
MSSIEQVLHRQVSRTLERYISPGERLLTAYSGGADSSALLTILTSTIDSEHLAAAYVNHHLRGEQELSDELTHLKTQTDELCIRLHILEPEDKQIQELAADWGSGTEEAARIIRYRLLEQCRREFGYDWILTAHHADDQAETVLMRVLKGSGPSGLRGIPEQRGRVIRPLLSVTREQVLLYTRELQVPFVEDSSNASDVYERNRIRHVLLPKIKELYPQAVSMLCVTAQKAALETEELESHRTVVTENPTVAQFNKLSGYQRMELLYRMWDNHGGEEKQLPYHIIRELVIHGIPSAVDDFTKELFQYSGSLCYAERGVVFLEKQVVSGRKIHYVKVVQSECVELYPGCYLTVRTSERIESDALCIRLQDRGSRLIARSALPGDVIQLSGGNTQVSKLFRDWKVPVHKRQLIPIIENEHGITGVMGRAFGYRDRVSREVKGTSESGSPYLSLRIAFD